MTTDRANKRTRIDPTVHVIEDVSEQKPTTKAPLLAAEEHISSQVLSLQPGLAAIILEHGKAHLRRLHRLYNKCVQIEKMEQDDDFFPRSVRFEFKLHCSRNTEQREGYSALKEKVDASLDKMKRAFKTHVIDATKLDRQTESEHALEEFVKSVRLIAEAFRIGRETAPPVDKMLASILDSHGEELTQHLGTEAEFKAKYLQIHNLSSWPSTATSSQLGTQDSTTPTPRSRLTNLVRKLLLDVFINAWDCYLKQYNNNKVALQLKQLQTNRELNDATEKASADINMEESIEPEKLSELVAKTAKKENQHLQKEVTNLTNQLKSIKELLKKDGRGKAGPVRQNRRRSKTPERNQRTNKKSPTNSTTRQTTRSTTSTSRSTNSTSKKKQPRKGNSEGGRNNDTSKNRGRRRQQNGQTKSNNRRN